MDDPFSSLAITLRPYIVHILIFLAALVIAVTIAHPSFLITDEWITVNQLSQLHDGHQLITSEGKYGTFENGTPYVYFTAKNNYLAYPLFLPLISLPANWLINFFGGAFVFFILYLWIFLLLAIAIIMNVFFENYTYIGKWRWTTGFIVATFILFFINLFFWRPFPVTGVNGHPEIMAVAFTNILLFAFLAVILYEVCRTIFRDPSYTIFGTVVCISCSSYLFWTNFCKDHVLTAFLFAAILLLVIKFLFTGNPWNLPGAFLVTGLLAWARPELALFVGISLVLFIVYTRVILKSRWEPARNRVLLYSAPLFTFIGAIPFCINNYLFTKNFFVPAWILWKPEVTSASSAVTGSGAIPGSADTLGSLVRLFVSTTNLNPATFPSDLYGVLLNPQSGSMGLLPLVPLFLVTLLLIPVFLTLQKITISREEKHIIIALVLLALGVFCAYARGLSGMNVSVGIVPDMRYMSPLYLPLDLLGLLAIRKLTFLSGNPFRLMTGMGVTSVIVIPISLIAMAVFYPTETLGDGVLFPYLDAAVTLAIYVLAVLFMLALIGCIVYNLSPTPAKIFLVLLCALPFIWQIDATFLARWYGTDLGGYNFWIPVVLKFFGLIFVP
jgi:hypothetical protein